MAMHEAICPGCGKTVTVSRWPFGIPIYTQHSPPEAGRDCPLSLRPISQEPTGHEGKTGDGVDTATHRERLLRSARDRRCAPAQAPPSQVTGDVTHSPTAPPHNAPQPRASRKG